MRGIGKGLALTAALALGLTACGGGDSGGSGSEAESGTALLIWADENRAEPISLPAAQANANWGHRGGAANHAQPHGALSAALKPAVRSSLPLK